LVKEPVGPPQQLPTLPLVVKADLVEQMAALVAVVQSELLADRMVAAVAVVALELMVVQAV
jgi:hypothetical protein